MLDVLEYLSSLIFSLLQNERLLVSSKLGEQRPLSAAAAHFCPFEKEIDLLTMVAVLMWMKLNYFTQIQGQHSVLHVCTYMEDFIESL